MLRNSVEYKRFVWELDNIIKLNIVNLNKLQREIIFLCIGTNMIIGDSFGPIVGTILKKSLATNNNVKVIGDLDNILTYNRIEKDLMYIKKKYKHNLIIVLDSALSSKSNIGRVFIQNRGLKYAEALKKCNHVIGNISIKAVVGENVDDNIENFINLTDVSVEKIKSMSSLVSNGIIEVINTICSWLLGFYKSVKSANICYKAINDIILWIKKKIMVKISIKIV